MLKKCWDVFVGWSFTPLGTAFWGSVGGGIMWLLTSLTTALNDYAPLSYGIAFFAGVIIAILILRGALSIWISFSQRLFTKKPTFIEYKVENRRINLIAKENIYREPLCNFQDKKHLKITNPVPQNRAQKRKAEATQDVPSQSITDLPSSASFLVHFEKPIHQSALHVRLENKAGSYPVMEGHVIDERWANVVLSNIPDNCSFIIKFN